jgi:hypothetical protein
VVCGLLIVWDKVAVQPVVGVTGSMVKKMNKGQDIHLQEQDTHLQEQDICLQEQDTRHKQIVAWDTEEEREKEDAVCAEAIFYQIHQQLV